jgi:hypothetical protein
LVDEVPTQGERFRRICDPRLASIFHNSWLPIRKLVLTKPAPTFPFPLGREGIEARADV